MTETRAIHPQSTQLFAESPYTRKLRRVKDDLQMVWEMAPQEHKEDVNAIILQMDMLIAGL